LEEKKKKMNIIRINLSSFAAKALLQPNIIVIYDPGEEYNPYPKLSRNQELLFLGEVKNAPGHGLFVDLGSKDFGGKIQGMYHLEHFWIQLEGIELVKNKTTYGQECYDVIDPPRTKD
jgi:hypothetical protein